ncbi:MAG TPA: DUF4166 domain-containing protein [Chthonomonadaceae bacterium]|nr:DUF4166 domain-containing protein [Chthonomonadaceae bacterium]
MADPDHNNLSLYRRTLGESFDSLPPVLQRFHDTPGGAIAEGSFRITWGQGWLRQALATGMRLPLPGEQVPALVQVRTKGDMEYWTRDFGSRRLVSRQWLRQGLLVETAGPFRIGFKVSTDATGMRFAFVRCWLFLLPLPNALAPRVHGWVTEHENGWWVQVGIELPVLGLLTQYEGKVTPR